MICVYYQNTALCFVRQAENETDPILHVTSNEELTPAKLLQKVENSNTLQIISQDPEQCFERFAAGLVAVEAAGGIVSRKDGSVMMIYRNGVWDLPKGHREKHETLPECAIREVEEECGLNQIKIDRFLTTTQHIYDTYGRWEMKRVWWYRMSCPDNTTEPKPQTEEGIQQAEWLAGRRLWLAVAGSYYTIRHVFDVYFNENEQSK